MRISDLTVLSFGGGQDSTAILLKILTDERFKERYAPDKLVVIMSDTGNEHPYTYEHVKYVDEMCKTKDIPFFFLTKEDGFHSEAWQDLITPQLRDEGEKFKPTMVQLGTKSCTDKLKIAPIYKFLDEYINDLMGYEFNVKSTRGCLKKAIKKFHEEEGKIRVLIGFAKGEEKRSIKANQIQDKDYAQGGDSWRKAIYREYPLIDESLDRSECQKFIEETIGHCPMPSNCILCPYQSDAELVWLSRNYPDWLEVWYKIEEKKLARYTHIVKNHGVYNSKKPLKTKVSEAIVKYKGWTDEQLNGYKNCHGCPTNIF